MWIEGEEKKLLASVMHLVLLYGALVWELAIHEVPGKLEKLRRIQRRVALRCVAAYCAVSYYTTNLLSGIPPIELLVEK